MSQALIQPDILRWARERNQLSIEATAEKIKVKPDTLYAWELGDAKPTFRQAQNLAHRLNIPFGYLFLSSPPQERLPLPDLRTTNRHQPSTPSPEFSDLLNDVLLKQQWYREYKLEENSPALPFIGRFSVSNDAEEIAEDIRNTLGVNDELRQSSSNWEEFLRNFILSSESVGILILRSGIVGNNTRRKLKVSEFRGFAISDDLAPLVFINGQDAKAAQIFTLSHELVHLWIGESGISNPNYRERSGEVHNEIERLCNRTAAEILLPKSEFQESWTQENPIEVNLQEIVFRFRVSTVAALRQAYDLEFLSSSEYWTYYQQEIEKYRARESRSGDGGNFYATLFARNSQNLTKTLISAAFEGRLSYRDTARLLNVKVNTLNGISERLFGERLLGG